MNRRAQLEAIMRMLAKEIEAEMSDASSGPPVGFALLVFDFGPGGFCAHASNARRADLVKLAAAFGLHRQTVYKIRHNERWAARRG